MNEQEAFRSFEIMRLSRFEIKRNGKTLFNGPLYTRVEVDGDIIEVDFNTEALRAMSAAYYGKLTNSEALLCPYCNGILDRENKLEMAIGHCGECMQEAQDAIMQRIFSEKGEYNG